MIQCTRPHPFILYTHTNTYHFHFPCFIYVDFDFDFYILSTFVLLLQFFSFSFCFRFFFSSVLSPRIQCTTHVPIYSFFDNRLCACPKLLETFKHTRTRTMKIKISNAFLDRFLGMHILMAHNETFAGKLSTVHSACYE